MTAIEQETQNMLDTMACLCSVSSAFRFLSWSSGVFFYLSLSKCQMTEILRASIVYSRDFVFPVHGVTISRCSFLQDGADPVNAHPHPHARDEFQVLRVREGVPESLQPQEARCHSTPCQPALLLHRMWEGISECLFPRPPFQICPQGG